MFTAGDKRWYVFYTHARAEKAAGKSISDLGFPVFIPTEKRLYRLPSGKRSFAETALFPRYGFVQFGPKEQWSQIRRVDKVVDVLRHDLIPIPVPDECIDRFKLADKLGIFDRTKPPAVGTTVQITSGPFGGWFGKIIRSKTDQRADVLIRFLGAECRATVPLNALRAAD